MVVLPNPENRDSWDNYAAENAQTTSSPIVAKRSYWEYCLDAQWQQDSAAAAVGQFSEYSR